MLYKPRTRSTELTVMELLNRRMNLASKDKRHYMNLKKGYDGEIQFDKLTNKLQCDCLVLNDFLLEINNTSFQIDSLIVTQGTVHFFEVKNVEGDYYCESEKMYKKPRKEIVNPLNQLSRSESLLGQLLISYGFNLPINASIVFINPAFTLYQAPLDKPIIFPTQIKRHMNQLQSIPSALTSRDKKLADQLVALHITNSRFEQLPSYNYNQLHKGIICPKCHSFSVSIVNRKCVCKACGHAELAADAIMRSVKEFKLLFPNEKVTTNVIYDWCRVISSKQRIRRVLARNYTIVGTKQWTNYE